MDCLCGFLTDIIKDLVYEAVNQLRYLCCFNNFVEELAKENGNLIPVMDDVKARIEDDDNQARITPAVAVKWVEDADTELDSVKELLKEARTRRSWCFGCCPNWIWRYNVGRKLENKTKELKEVIEQGKNIPPGRVAPLPSRIPDSNSEKYLSFASRQNAYKELMEAVIDDEAGMIGLYGMGGCGKTTMAMEVLKVAEADNQKVLFVAVSSTVEVRTIQNNIASSLQFTFPFEENGERDRAIRLYERLTKEKKIIVILDDVWQRLDFDAIGIPSPKHHKGRCKVLITTRSADVCNSMDCSKTIHLPILEDDEAWTLFQKEAHINEGTSASLKDLARQISDECKGLPVAIAAFASTLKGKEEVRYWKVALNRLRSSKPVHIERGLPDPYKCLELSYHDLDDEAAKSLFLLCSVFPEDYGIPVELLARSAIGLGLVGEVGSYEEARTEVIAAKIKLMNCCLLLDASHYKHECVKMHDLVRDVAHWIGKNENRGIKCEVENDVTWEQNSVRYLWCKKLPNDLDYSNLEFLYVATKVEVLDEIFTGMGKLRVLVLENERSEGELPLPLSTMSFKSLTNLRCLILLGWKLNDISFIRYMKELESLSLKDCSLPSCIDLHKDDAVSHLTKLKLLVLYACEMESNIFEVIERIPQLEELYILCSGFEFHETFSFPKTLQRSRIIISKHYSSYDPWDFLTSNERSLTLESFDISNEAIMCLAKKAKSLLMGSIKRGAKNIIPDIFQLEGGRISELEDLRIEDADDIECLFFKQVITPNPMPYTIFQNLQEVRVIRCGELKYLFSANTVRALPQLNKLKIYQCDKFEQIVEDIISPVLNEVEITESASYVNQNTGSYFSKLKQVDVRQCHKLKHLFSVSASNDFLYLEELIVHEAAELKKFIEFEQGTLNNFQFLKTLEIIKCAKLEVIFPESVVRCKESKHIIEEDESDRIQTEPCFIESRNHTGEVVRFLLYSLERLYLESCQKLTSLFFTQAITTPNPALYTMFQNLQQVEIFECEELKYIFSVNIAGGLPQLNKLSIRFCNNLEQIAEDIISSVPNELEIIEENVSTPSVPFVNHNPGPCFPKLKRVYVEECHKLKRLFSVSASNDLSYLEELIINGADGLEELIRFEQGAFHNFKFQRLKTLEINRCEKLEVIFPVLL